MPCPSFQTSTFASGGINPREITVADFNGDGIPDLAVANSGSSNISVFLGNGAGGFSSAPGSPFASGGSGAFSITSVDFNGDGIPDLAVANEISNSISVFLGNGTGGFALAPGSPFSSGGISPVSITSADFDGDGIPDLAVAHLGSSTISVFLGNGVGGFSAAPGSPFLSGGSNSISITSADFDGDGIPDLAVVDFTSSTVSVFLGNGAGGFSSAIGSPFPTGGSQPQSITAADFNGDGIPDLAVANEFSNSISVFLGNGAGGFASASGSPFSSGGTRPRDVTVLDINCDGIPDLAVTNLGSDTVAVFLGNGTGGFSPAGTFSSGGGPVSIVSADFNGDGRFDLAIANLLSDTISILINTCDNVPVPTCPANITTTNDTGQCGALVNYPAPTVTDPCGVVVSVSCFPASGSFFPVGTTTVTCTATDASGNTSAPCSFEVTVNDTEPPIITCTADITVSNDPGECGAIVIYSAPTISDNCPGATAVCSPASGSFFPVGTTTVTCTATDAAGNTSTCLFTVTVVDTEPPVITCTADITVSNDPGECGAIVIYPAPTISDNCPGVTAVCSPASGSFFPVGTTTVTCTATDAAGNTSAPCSFTVTVNDTEPPVITCPADIRGFNDPGRSGAFVNFPEPTVSDNCPGVTAVCTPASGSFFPPGTTTVTCTATDAAGNTSTCSFDVRVIVDPCRFLS